MQTKQEREIGGERVIYTQAQGSMNKFATHKVSRGENKRKGKKCLGVLSAMLVGQISARIVRRSANLYSMVRWQAQH